MLASHSTSGQGALSPPAAAQADAAATAAGTEVEVSVVLPCLNEARTVAACVRQARETFARHAIAGEVVVADNGSSDDSPRLAEEAGARVVHVQPRGYGHALAAGFAAARGAFIVMGDADGSYDFSHLPRFLSPLRAGSDLVLGNRFRGGIRPGAMPLLHRYLGNPVLTALGRLFFRSPCGDFHCGLRAFRREAIQSLDLRTTGMEFASEMIVKATLAGLKISEVPTTLAPDGRGRPPHLRTWRDGWRHLRFLLLYSPRWLFLYPGLALMLAGVAVMALLLPGPRTAGGVVFDVHTLLYGGVAVVLGFQAVVLAIFSSAFAAAEGLLPPGAPERGFAQRLSLERGLLIGALLVGLGLLGSLTAVSGWAEQAFGPYDPGRALRVIVPSIVLLMLGGQIVLASFFLSLLRLGRR